MATQSELAGPKPDYSVDTPGHVLRKLAETGRLLHKELADIRSRLIDYTRPVDEYLIGSGNTAAEPGSGLVSPIILKPDFDTVDELITNILVVTPTAATNVVLELGNRIIPLPAGIASIPAPLAMILAKTDIRQLAWSGGGTGWFELMGYAYGGGG